MFNTPFARAAQLERLEGTDRLVFRLADLLRKHVTAADGLVCDALREFELEQGGGAAAEEEAEEELQWTWDPDFASEDIKVLNYGTVLAMIKSGNDEDVEPGKWQMMNDRGGTRGNDDAWDDLDPALSMLLERDYRSGRFYLEQMMTVRACKDCARDGFCHHLEQGVEFCACDI